MGCKDNSLTKPKSRYESETPIFHHRKKKIKNLSFDLPGFYPALVSACSISLFQHLVIQANQKACVNSTLFLGTCFIQSILTQHSEEQQTNAQFHIKHNSVLYHQLLRGKNSSWHGTGGTYKAQIKAGVSTQHGWKTESLCWPSDLCTRPVHRRDGLGWDGTGQEKRQGMGHRARVCSRMCCSSNAGSKQHPGSNSEASFTANVTCLKFI